MPELPDVTVYCEALDSRLIGRKLVNVKLASPFDPFPRELAEKHRVLRFKYGWEFQNPGRHGTVTAPADSR